ncbi:GNAT family N-acetyltransferase [Pleomorphomonas oryzae]|uniref:GNAT family N-acetyltransferase n=1 Tax=Pleomorphomonas oryzae TaxID=261934 RepID=UPI00047D5591|nr:GNAT family N-acetyltransferase [Pleomorphomonas oryzae]
MNRISVGVEPPLQDEVSALLAQSDAVAAALYPGAFRRVITAASLAHPDIQVVVARRGGKAVGLCVLFDRGDRSMELKRMIVAAEARGAGVGRALLQAAEAEALKGGAELMLLEVGIYNTDAQQLYRRGGYQPTEAFPPYQPTPISLFMRRRLER